MWLRIRTSDKKEVTEKTEHIRNDVIVPTLAKICRGLGILASEPTHVNTNKDLIATHLMDGALRCLRLLLPSEAAVAAAAEAQLETPLPMALAELHAIAAAQLGSPLRSLRHAAAELILHTATEHRASLPVALAALRGAFRALPDASHGAHPAAERARRLEMLNDVNKLAAPLLALAPAAEPSEAASGRATPGKPAAAGALAAAVRVEVDALQGLGLVLLADASVPLRKTAAALLLLLQPTADAAAAADAAAVAANAAAADGGPTATSVAAAIAAAGGRPPPPPRRPPPPPPPRARRRRWRRRSSRPCQRRRRAPSQRAASTKNAPTSPPPPKRK